MADALKDGWLDLPSGGSVEIRDGIPVRVTDNERYMMDDGQILREAAEATQSQLVWAHTDRSRRWRRRGLFEMLAEERTSFRKQVAEVLRDACSNCGVNVGERKVQPDGGYPIEWACRRCAHAMLEHHLSPEKAIGFECDRSCQPHDR